MLFVIIVVVIVIIVVIVMVVVISGTVVPKCVRVFTDGMLEV